MQMDTRRLVLRAALQKLLEGHGQGTNNGTFALRVEIRFSYRTEAGHSGFSGSYSENRDLQWH